MKKSTSLETLTIYSQCKLETETVCLHTKSWLHYRCNQHIWKGITSNLKAIHPVFWFVLLFFHSFIPLWQSVGKCFHASLRLLCKLLETRVTCLHRLTRAYPNLESHIIRLKVLGLAMLVRARSYLMLSYQLTQSILVSKQHSFNSYIK